MIEPAAPLYRRILGPAFATLPPRLQELHGSADRRRWTGEAAVRRGGGAIARLVAAAIGLPEAGTRVPVAVIFTPEQGAERWTRNFGGRTFSSVQSCGVGRNRSLLVERFGIATIAIALVVEGERLFLVPRRWSLLGLPMPRFVLPGGASFETEDAGQFRFDVEISMPLIGLIAAYRGTLRPAECAGKQGCGDLASVKIG